MDRWLDGWIETPRDQETERGKEMRSMNAGSGALNDCRHDGGAEGDIRVGDGDREKVWSGFRVNRQSVTVRHGYLYHTRNLLGIA